MYYYVLLSIFKPIGSHFLNFNSNLSIIFLLLLIKHTVFSSYHFLLHYEGVSSSKSDSPTTISLTYFTYERDPIRTGVS